MELDELHTNSFVNDGDHDDNSEDVATTNLSSNQSDTSPTPPTIPQGSNNNDTGGDEDTDSISSHSSVNGQAHNRQDVVNVSDCL